MTKPADIAIADLDVNKMLELWHRSMQVLEAGLESPDERIRVTCAKHLETLGRRVLSADKAAGRRVTPAKMDAAEARAGLRAIAGGKAG